MFTDYELQLLKWALEIAFVHDEDDVRSAKLRKLQMKVETELAVRQLTQKS